MTEGEAELVARAQRDPDAFGALYDRYVDQLWAWARARTATREDAEDLTADVFFRALRGLPRYEWRGVPFGAWLFRIAANVLRDQASLGRGPMVEAPTDDGGVEAVIERARLTAVVDRLPPTQQEVIELRFRRDLSLAQVAAVTGRTVGAVKQLQLRALRTLREWCDE